MNATDALSMAWTHLRRRKGRSALTAAGVVIGVASLVLMISLGLGVQRQVLRLFETEDSLRTLSVTRVKTDAGKKKPTSFNLFQMGGQMAPITEKDLVEIRALPGVALAVPDLNMLMRVSVELPSGTASVDFFPVAGVDPAEEAHLRETLVEGRMWTSPTEKECILPTAFLEFRLSAKPHEVIGRKISFTGVANDEEDVSGNFEFRIVGVFDSERIGIRGRQIHLPMARAMELRDLTKGGFSFFPYKQGTYGSAVVRVADPRAVPDVKARLHNSGYQVLSAADLIESINLIFLVIEGFMACSGAIGLIVALFGIANTMAMAVLERTREIGIMKALGARDADIGRLFRMEAALLGSLGGAVGLGLGFATGKLLNAVARGVLDIPDRVSLFHVTPWLAIGSIVFALAVSVLAGVLPARRAARLDPVAALRYE